MFSLVIHNDDDLGIGFPFSDPVRRSSHFKRLWKRKHPQAGPLSIVLIHLSVDGGRYPVWYGRCQRD